MPIISHSELTDFCVRILTAAGVPQHKADITATSLVASNLRGVDSHGIQLLPFYLDQLLAGEVDAKADGHVISEHGSCLMFDAESSLGQWVGEVCCGHAVRIASSQGMALVISRNSNHFGAAAWWAQKMRAAGQIGIVMCNASPIVPPWQGKEGRMGTNPICMSVPGPWLLDMATLGGYKGSGLAMMVEILCSVLSGGLMSTEIGGIRQRGRKVGNSQLFMAIDIAHFMPVDEFTARVEKLVALMKSTPAAPGYDEVMVAGDPEWRTEAKRREKGIPIADGNWDSLCKAAARVSVGAPKV
jgi:LDH2 family malate/lactate/ureidoglycolate dehydrogenase